MRPQASTVSSLKAGRQSVWRKHWWALALVVLILLVAIIYVLSHLSAADSEMYPTTMLKLPRTILRLC